MRLSRECITESVEARFWSKVDRSGGPNACWPWTAGRFASGYGAFTIGGRIAKAHRVAFVLSVGEIGDLRVCHRCDNPPCCNPSHLWLGTDGENQRDKREKGRGRGAPGESSGKAKLAWVDIETIRSSPESKRSLALRFGVSVSQIYRIVSRENWL